MLYLTAGTPPLSSFPRKRGRQLGSRSTTGCRPIARGRKGSLLKSDIDVAEARFGYAMVRVFPTRLNCFPMCAEKADDAALTLPISPPLLKSWAPCSVMFSGGLPPRKKSVSQSWAVFCSHRTAAHPLHAGVVGDVLVVLQHFAAFDLPAHAGIVYVVQAFSMQGVGKGCTRIDPKGQMERCCQPTTAVGNEEVHECPGWIIEAHHIGSVLGGDIQVVIGTETRFRLGRRGRCRCWRRSR